MISYYYIKGLMKYIDITRLENLIIDSGAFTFMNGKKITKNLLEGFVDEYINFIKQYNIKHYLEMDVDSIFGHDYVLEIREKLEKETNRKSIPVWHKSRGLDEFIKLCKNYDYIAIGGIVTQEIKRKEWDILIKLNKIASQYNCKVHGLGFTPTKEIEKYGFYSCDSSSWTTGHRFKGVFYFENGEVKKIDSKKLINKRIDNYNNLVKNNFLTWVKYQKKLDN